MPGTVQQRVPDRGSSLGYRCQQMRSQDLLVKLSPGNRASSPSKNSWPTYFKRTRVVQQDIPWGTTISRVTCSTMIHCYKDLERHTAVYK